MIPYFLIVRSFGSPVRRMLAAQGLVGMGMGIFAVLLNLYLRAVGLAEGTIGRLLALQSMSAAIASIPMGWLADRTSRRTTYLTGLVFMVLGAILMSQSRDFGSFVLASILGGIGIGGTMVSVQPFLQENSRRRQRSILYSLSSTIMWLTSILSGIMAGNLPTFFQWLWPMQGIQEADRLQWSLRVGVGIMVLAFFQAYRLPEDKKTDDGDAVMPHLPDESANQVPPWEGMARFMLCSGLIGCGAGMIVPYFNLYFRDWVGATIPQIGTIFALGQFGTALGSFASPWITRRAGLIHGVLITQVLSLPFMALMAVQHSFWLCALCFIFRGAFMNMGMPIRQETLMEVMPARFRARAAATDSMSWNLAWAGSMFFSGSIIKNYGYGASLWIAVVCYAASAVLYRWFFLDWERKRLATKRKG